MWHSHSSQLLSQWSTRGSDIWKGDMSIDVFQGVVICTKAVWVVSLTHPRTLVIRRRENDSLVSNRPLISQGRTSCL